jgi:uncharacterized protein YbjT (DUF2867 family)
VKTLLIIGGTGQVGRQLLAQALAHSAVAQVIAPTRQPLAPHAKLLNPVVDFAALPHAEWWRADALLSALGTTRRQAGSAAAFRTIDHDYVFSAAKLARAAGTPVCVNNSSVGANPKAHGFYLQVKGELERDLEMLGFESVCHVRPSLLNVDDRAETRVGERIGVRLFRWLNPLVPARYRSVTTASVAAAMLAAALAPTPGTTVIESEQLHPA